MRFSLFDRPLYSAKKLHGNALQAIATAAVILKSPIKDDVRVYMRRHRLFVELIIMT